MKLSTVALIALSVLVLALPWPSETVNSAPPLKLSDGLWQEHNESKQNECRNLVLEWAIASKDLTDKSVEELTEMYWDCLISLGLAI